MTQQVGMTLGTPIVSDITIAAGGLTSLFALRVGIGIDAAIIVMLILLIWLSYDAPTAYGRRALSTERHGSVRPRHKTGSTVPNRAHSSDVRRPQATSVTPRSASSFVLNFTKDPPALVRG